MSDTTVHSRRIALGLAVGAGVAVMAVASAGLFGDLVFEPKSVGADAFSNSALGHSGLLTWLEQRGHPQIILRSRTNRDAIGRAPLLALEPAAFDAAARLQISWLANRTAPTLLVLPRRVGEVDPERPNWIGKVGDVTPQDVQKVLELAGLAGVVERPAGAVEFRYGEEGRALTTTNPQLVVSSRIDPIVDSPEGVLFGRVRDRRSFYVLSDPDLLANHGIDDPGHRAFLDFVMDTIVQPGNPLAIDETIHGATFERDVWREAVRMPLLPLTLSILLTAGLAVWAARRFLDPCAEARTFAAGKRLLIDNTAGLHLESDRLDELARRYRSLVEYEAGAALRVSEKLTPERRRAEIERRATLRGRPFDLENWCSTIRENATGRGGARKALAAMTELKRWRDEVIRGTSGG